VAHRPFVVCKDALELPDCSVNPWFPRDTCLKLFKFSARSPGGNLKSADKRLLSLSLSQNAFGWHFPDLLWADLSKWYSFYYYYYMHRSNSVRALQFVSEISGGTLERSAMQHVLFGRVTAPLLTLVHPRQRCTLIKDSFKFKARPNTTGRQTSP